MNEKETYENESFSRAGIAVLAALAVACASFIGCRSLGVDAGGVGERNQYISGRLDSTIKSLDRELAYSNEQVRECLERSRDIESGAERLKYLVERYFEIVGRIQGASDKAVAELRSLEEGMRDDGRDTCRPDIGECRSPVSGTYEEDRLHIAD